MSSVSVEESNEINDIQKLQQGQQEQHIFNNNNDEEMQDKKNEVSQIQMKMNQIVKTPTQKRYSNAEQDNSQNLSMINNSINSKDTKLVSNAKNVSSISTHTVDLQNNLIQHQLNVPKKLKPSVQQNNSQTGDLNDNVAPFIPKPALINHIHYNSSSPSLRIFNGGKKKRVKSDKEDLQFYRSPHHEKKYLGNEIYPPEPLKIQELPYAQQDLHTFKPQISQPATQVKNNNNRPYQSHETKNVDIEYIEYVSSPVTVKNIFKNNPNCMHNLVNKKTLRKTHSTNFILMRTINLQENRKNIFTSIHNEKYQPNKNQTNVLQQLQSVSLVKNNQKPQIKEHISNDYRVQGQNKIQYKNGGQYSQRLQNQIKLPPFAVSLENMNNFSVAKNNLIKYVNTIKL